MAFLLQQTNIPQQLFFNSTDMAYFQETTNFISFLPHRQGRSIDYLSPWQKRRFKKPHTQKRVHQEGSKFSFYIENKAYDQTPEINDGYSGVGLENIKKNLAIVYPDTHSFEITDREDRFGVYLPLISKPL